MRKHVEKAIEKAADKQLEKAKNITPVMALEPESVKHPEPEKIPAAIKRAIEAGYRELIDEINARKERIEELEMEIAEFEKEIDVIKDWEVEHI
jgi:hypothetical protein